MKNFLKSLLSRKFLLALGSFLVAVANGEWNVAMAIVLGYLGVEGSADAVERYNKSKMTPEQMFTMDEEKVDKNTLVTGNIPTE